MLVVRSGSYLYWIIDTCRSFFNGGGQSGSSLSQRNAKNKCFSFYGEEASGFDLIERVSNFDCNPFNGSTGRGFASQFINPYACTPFVASANEFDGFIHSGDFNTGICLVIDLPIESSRACQN